MTRESREELRTKAQACIPRKWKSEVWLGNEDGGFAAIGPHHNRKSEKDFEDDPDDGNGVAAKADSEFIAAANPTAVLSLLALVDKYEEVIATSAAVRDGCCWCVECGKMETRGCVVRPCGDHESKEHCEHQIAREALKGVG